MSTITVVHLLLLFVHLLAFAAAAGCILREDAKLIFGRKTDRRANQVHETARVVFLSLIALWATGLAMVFILTEGSLGNMLSSPKLLAKLTVVSALTLNGVLLHYIAFPAMVGKRSAAPASLLAVLGGISGASWLYATFVGLSNPIAEHLGFAGYMALYGFVLLCATAFALGIVRPKIARLVAERHRKLGTTG